MSQNQASTGRSVWAVVAGLLVNAVPATAIDALLHAQGVFPPLPQPLTDKTSAIAISYRLLLGVAGAYLTARLAPQKPMKHALILGSLGTLACLGGLIVSLTHDLGPVWYPAGLLVSALPLSWLGATLWLRGR